ncbi:unnamed protein product [Durusdinium trenchii]|uniref:WW domain-containing protein n=2 Tax=Durusdinium trenchii TaxID=1381693 RepID=A0ABP0LWV6_9DINO
MFAPNGQLATVHRARTAWALGLGRAPLLTGAPRAPFEPRPRPFLGRWFRAASLAPCVVLRKKLSLWSDGPSGNTALAPKSRGLPKGRRSHRRLHSTAKLPAMSKDGGSQEEFEEYWKWFKEPRQVGEWIERRSHPQVNLLPYWYHSLSDETVFEAPSTEEAKVLEPLEPLELQGPIASLSVPELRSKLQDPEELQRLEFTDALLARRAVWEYETFIPRVLSWHDFQYNTFWFFIKERGSKDRREEKRGYFGPGADDSKMFAHEGFFMEVAHLASQRLERIHPINLVYLLWTFTRAGVQAHDFFNKAADHFCNGLLPSLDRCGLCTLVWCFSRQRLRHQRLFEKAAVELQRTLRVRSLAPRNFQNTMIAYRWFGRGHHEAVDALPPTLAQWLPRLLDGHDERTPKLRKEVMFSYTCQDGSVVPADAFRINGLNLIARGFLHLDAGSAPSVEACFESMTDYVLRSGRRSPNWMRSDGDLCQFALVVAEAAAKGWPGAASWLERLEAQLQLIRANARPRELSQLETALEHAKMAASAS